ncbi:Maf family protein [Corynebacterium heidelbergense]|uniref:Nucleoside triphosphate pyrophosphatase n=1 Tax=Corynebacterium heidelbergense TaxID=2055947 RepID=A0A364V8D3_9CORY|nr:nucleoside triphosphate pyrophosphatase [Corynebacterium heidelbergense]RAV32912.1 septum formation inhibitor Maf [Corynebacterium heidelbergense]
MRVVLASSSPSRLAVLRNAGIEPDVRTSGVDEDAVVADLPTDRRDPEAVVQALALAKARAVAEELADPEAVVIGGDSMLLIDGELQGKPHTEEETVRRWLHQRGKTAELLSGHAVLRGTARYTEVSRSRIHFAVASDRDIRAYAHTGEPFGCAGAFTLEALGGWFIDRVEGDPSGVLGLSLPVVRRALASFGLPVSAAWNRV